MPRNKRKNHYILPDENLGSQKVSLDWIHRPDRSALRAVLKVLHGVSVEMMREALAAGMSLEASTRYVPFILFDYEGELLKWSEKYALWTLRCGWYHYGGGDRPQQIARSPKPVDVTEWAQDLCCPLCNRLFPGQGNYKKKADALVEFASWLKLHSKECQKHRG